jgi:hypothetical protein
MDRNGKVGGRATSPVGAFQVQMDTDASLNVSRDCLSHCVVLRKREASSKSFLLFGVISYAFVVGWDRLSDETREKKTSFESKHDETPHLGPESSLLTSNVNQGCTYLVKLSLDMGMS